MKIEEQEINVESVIKDSEQKIYELLRENKQMCSKIEEDTEV